MAKISHNSDSWHARGVIKRDFQHDKSGPEVIPHKKKGTGKKFCKKHKGPHVFDTYTEWSTYGTWRYRYKACACGKRGFGGDGMYQSQRLRTMTRYDGTTYTYWS